MRKPSRTARAGIFATLIMTMLLSVFSTQVAHAEDDYSFYRLSSSVATFFGNSFSPDKMSEYNGDASKNPFTDKWKWVIEKPGVGGSLVGYSDKKIHESALDWGASIFSGSSRILSYDSFDGKKLVANGGDNNISHQGVLDYAHYGSALASLGFDSTASNFDSIIGMGRGVTGAIMFIAFGCAVIVDWVFFAMLSMLKVLNPFALFWVGINAIQPEMAKAISDKDPNGTGSLLKGIADLGGGLYTTAYDIATKVGLPLLLALFIINLLIRKQGHGNRFKKFMVRLVFLALLFPMMGATYTGVLDGMLKETGGRSVSATGAAKVVLSNYVDFEAWALNSRLAVSDGKNFGMDCKMIIQWDPNSNSPSGESVVATRDTAVCINTVSGEYGNIGALISASGSDPTQNNAFDASGNIKGDEDPTAGIKDNLTGKTFTLLLKYMAGSKVSASDFETGIKSQITADVANGDIDGNKATSWFKDYNNPDMKDKNVSDPDNGNPVIYVTEPLQVRTVDNNSGTVREYYSSSSILRDGKHCGYIVIDPGTKKSSNCNMSALAMYNYLNTTFDSASLTVYSSQNASSGATREVHYSVTAIGGNAFAGMMYWFNSVAILICYSFIGFAYALSMLVNSITRGIKLIMNVPLATVGFLGRIVKVMSYFVAMVLEILGTFFLYMLVQEFILAMPQITEKMASGIASKIPVVGGVMYVLMMYITMPFTAIFILFFTYKAWKLRGDFVRGLSEACAQFIEKLVGAEGSAPNMMGYSPVTQAAMAGAGAGAMYAAGSKANKAFGGGPSDTPPGGQRPGGIKMAPQGPKPKGGGSGTGGTGDGRAALPAGRGGAGGIAALPPGPSGSGSGGSGGKGGDAFVDAEQPALEGNLLDADGQPLDQGGSFGATAPETSDPDIASSLEQGADDKALASQVMEQGGLSNIDNTSDADGSANAGGTQDQSKVGTDGAAPQKGVSGQDSAGSQGKKSLDRAADTAQPKSKGPRGGAGGSTAAEPVLEGTILLPGEVPAKKRGGSVPATQASQSVGGSQGKAQPSATPPAPPRVAPLGPAQRVHPAQSAKEPSIAREAAKGAAINAALAASNNANAERQARREAIRRGGSF